MCKLLVPHRIINNRNYGRNFTFNEVEQTYILTDCGAEIDNTQPPHWQTYTTPDDG